MSKPAQLDHRTGQHSDTQLLGSEVVSEEDSRCEREREKTSS